VCHHNRTILQKEYSFDAFTTNLSVTVTVTVTVIVTIRCVMTHDDSGHRRAWQLGS
jgi:hypothetical protein